jgi:hypothetical protein
MNLNNLDPAKGGREMCVRGEEPAAKVGAWPPKSGVGASIGVEEGEIGEVSSWAAVGCACG